MKIIRDGVEIELTGAELNDAYIEQQNIYDMMDIRDAVDQNEDLDEELAKAILENIDGIAYDMRNNIDKYEMHWDYARDEAIRDFRDAFERENTLERKV